MIEGAFKIRKGEKSLTDSEIIDGLLRHSEEALILLRNRYEAYCYHIAFSLLRDEDAVSECVNDVWMALWCIKEHPATLKSYIAKVTRNAALMQMRKSSAKKRSANLLLLDELAECIPDSAHSASPDTQHLRWVLQRFVRELKAEERSIFLKRYWYGYTSAEIAEELRYREGKVRSILFRTRKKLKALLQKEGISI